MIEIIPCMLLSRLNSPEGQRILNGYSYVTISERLPHFSSDWKPVLRVGYLYIKEPQVEAYCHLKNHIGPIQVSNSLLRCVRET